MGNPSNALQEAANVASVPQTQNDDPYKKLLELAKQPDDQALLNAIAKQINEETATKNPKMAQVDINLTSQSEEVKKLAIKIRNIADKWKKANIDDITMKKEVQDLLLLLKESVERKNNGKKEEVEQVRTQENFDPKTFKKAQEAEKNNPFIDRRTTGQESEYANGTWFDGITGTTALAAFTGLAFSVSTIASLQSGSQSSAVLGLGAFVSFNYVKNQLSPRTEFETAKIDKMAGEYGVSSQYIKETLLKPENVAFYEGLLGKQLTPSKEDDQKKYGNTIEMVDQLKGLNRSLMNAINFNSFQSSFNNAKKWDPNMTNIKKKEWIKSFLGDKPESFSFITRMNNPEAQAIIEKPGPKGNMYDVWYAMITQLNTMKVWNTQRANAFLKVGEEGEKLRYPDAVAQMFGTDTFGR